MDAQTLVAMLIIVALAIVLVMWQAIRKGVLRRLAVRDAIRRPSETTLVIIGSLLGTAIVTGSFIVGDTLDSSIRATASTQLGPVDEVITVPSSDGAAEVTGAIEDLDDRRIDGIESFLRVPASFSAGGPGARRAEPEAQAIELDFDSGRSFGRDASATGIAGDTPGAGEAAITEDIATTLDVVVGDQITGYLYGRETDLEVTSVLPRLGLAGYWNGFESTSSNVFLEPGTIETLSNGRIPSGAEPPTTIVAVSNRGGVEDGADLTHGVTTAIEEALPAESQLRVEPIKQDRLDDAESQGEQFSEIFLGIGSFAVVAGVLLLVNIFVMLSEERKAQLGMLRAVGMRRADLVRGFVIEGAIYALLASVLGAVVGIGVGWVIVRFAAPIFGGSGDFSLDLIFDADIESIIGGFCIGVLISLVTILFTSFRISRVNIIRAIRDLPEPRLARSRLRTVIAGAMIAALAVAWFVTSVGGSNGWLGSILGPPLAAFGLLPLLSRVIGRRTAVLLVSGGTLVWGIFGNRITDGAFFEGGDIFAFVVQGILLTFSSVILLSQSQETLEGGIRRVAARWLSLRLGLAYPLARRFRTGLTLGMYSLVIFTMVFISVLSNVFGGQIDNAVASEAGEWQALVTASGSNPPKPDEVEDAEGVDRVATLTFGGALFQPKGFTEPEAWPLSGVDEDFFAVKPPPLEERLEAYSTDQEAWDALLEDSGAMIVDIFFLQGEGGPPESVVEPGDTMTVIDPVTGAPTERRVTGITSAGQAFSGAFMSTESAKEASSTATPSRFYLTTDRSDQEAAAVTNRIQGDFLSNGVEAQTFRALIEESQQGTLQFFDLMQGYLALGLVVGVAGLGVLMVRAVRERRRDVGVLRSLGFEAHQVRRAFVLEAGFVALEGILVGAALALVTASQLVKNGDFGEGIELIIPWDQLGILTGTALAASLLATAWPAQQASSIPPAVALRVAD
ncbi:MAG: ABC transporter permease [Actinomycetota bacterium]|nr:ABC transporter permease [Actinomycetota bacterium]